MFPIFQCLSGRKRPMEPVPFPNRLQAADLNQSILKHMAARLEFRLGEILRLVTSNCPSSATSTYHLLARKLYKYRETTATLALPEPQRSSDSTLLRHNLPVTNIGRQVRNTSFTSGSTLLVFR